LTVSVDEGRNRIVDQGNARCIDGIPLSGRHVAHVFRDDTALETARFRFEEGRTLVLRYDPFYAHVHIEAPRRRPRPTDDGTCAACPNIPISPAPPKPDKLRHPRPLEEDGEPPGWQLK
jgi:hypothetical protein